MSRVFVNMGISLDGYVAGPNRGPSNPMGDRAVKMHEWLFKQQAFLDLQKMPGKGETGADNRIVEHTFQRIGANIMGKRMFDEGEANWPEEAPFHAPVFVLTKQERVPWERPGGTTFHFVHGGIEDTLRMARAAAGAKDVRISGGASVVRQYLNAGLVDEVELALSSVLLGEGLRLFEGIDPARVRLKLVEATPSPYVTHIRYRVERGT